MQIQATQLRTGMLIQMDGDLFRVMTTQHITPGNKRGHMQTTLRNIQSGTKVDHRFRSSDRVERAMLDSQEMEYLYATINGNGRPCVYSLARVEENGRDGLRGLTDVAELQQRLMVQASNL